MICRVRKQGDTTLITIPKPWAKNNELLKGDMLDIDEKNINIIRGRRDG